MIIPTRPFVRFIVLMRTSFFNAPLFTGTLRLASARMIFAPARNAWRTTFFSSFGPSDFSFLLSCFNPSILNVNKPTSHRLHTGEPQDRVRLVHVVHRENVEHLRSQLETKLRGDVVGLLVPSHFDQVRRSRKHLLCPPLFRAAQLCDLRPALAELSPVRRDVARTILRRGGVLLDGQPLVQVAGFE